MKLSICIPVFNQNIKSLIHKLLEEIETLEADAEIVVLDDGSDDEKKSGNRLINRLPHIHYEELAENIGRAAIRNRLAEKARGKYLLFLDDDSLVYQNDFLKNYLDAARENTVICGGRKYPDNDPEDKFRLHYRYGIARESRPASQRGIKPYQSFHTNNFLIPREIVLKIRFDESIRDYGHEDTLFGAELKKARVPIRHIDNPIMHDRLENNQEFLQKTTKGLRNLYRIYERNDPHFNESVKLLRTFNKVVLTGMDKVLAQQFNSKQQKWKKQLTQNKKPSVRLLNLYKLAYLCHLRNT